MVTFSPLIEQAKAELELGPEIAISLPQALQIGVQGYCTGEGFLFFVGFCLGFRNIGVSADLSAFRMMAPLWHPSATVNLATLYAGPTLGIRFTVSQGFYLEANLGIQLSIYGWGYAFLSNAMTGANSNNSSNLQVDSNMAMSRVASIALPSISLIRLVRYF
ncbi:unnamed protein product [Sphagnum tenellum]